VAINNYLEDRAAASTGAKWFECGKQTPITTQYRATHNRTEEEVASAIGNCTATVPREVLKQVLWRTRPPQHPVTSISELHGQSGTG
jgi:hypothetical protein